MTDTEQLIAQARHMAKLHPGWVWAKTMEELCDALEAHVAKADADLKHILALVRTQNELRDRIIRLEKP